MEAIAEYYESNGDLGLRFETPLDLIVFWKRHGHGSGLVKKKLQIAQQKRKKRSSEKKSIQRSSQRRSVSDLGHKKARHHGSKSNAFTFVVGLISEFVRALMGRIRSGFESDLKRFTSLFQLFSDDSTKKGQGRHRDQT